MSKQDIEPQFLPTGAGKGFHGSDEAVPVPKGISETTTVGGQETIPSDPWSRAREYRQLGWSTIPIKLKSKQPLIRSRKESQDRKPTNDELRSWETNYPHCNVAVVCGMMSDLIVVDIDSDDGPISSWISMMFSNLAARSINTNTPF